MNWQDRPVLVTGAGGFIGSHLVDELLRREADVTAFVHYNARNDWGMLEGRYKDSTPHLKVIAGDVTDALFVKKAVSGKEVVFHLAALIGIPYSYVAPESYVNTNIKGTLNLMQASLDEQVSRIVHTSTSETYGNPAVVPTPESYYGYVNSIGIRGCYDESKRCGEAYVMAYRKQYGMDVRIARIFNTYGPRIRPDGIYGRAIPRFISQALRNEPITVFGSGVQTRSFCYTTDQVVGLLQLASSHKASGEVINIGNDKETTIIELAEIVKKLTGSVSKIEFHPLPQDDPAKRCPDLTKAKKILGWQPKVKLEDGLRKTIKWLSEAGVSVPEKK